MAKNQRMAGAALTYVSEAIKVLTGLLYTPVMLRLLGQSEYGLYQLVYSFVSYLSLLSFGFGSSYMRFYSRYKADNDEEGIAKLNGAYLLIFSVISVICVLCGTVMVANIRTIFGNGLTDKEYDTAVILMWLMIANLAMTFLISALSGPITAHECFVFQRGLTIAQNILNPFLTLPLLLLGYGSIGMVSITTLLTLATLLCNFYYSRKKLKVKIQFKGMHLSLFKEMGAFTFFIFINNIIDQINWSVDKFLLGRMIGTTAVAVYGVGGQINSMYVQFSTAVSGVFVPKVNRLVATENDNKQISDLFAKVGRVQFIILMLVATGFVFFGRPFIRYWAGAEYDEAYVVTLFLMLPVTVPLVQNLGIEIQRAKNKHKARSIVYLCIAVGNIILSIFLIQLLGPTGAALGTAIALFLGNIIFMNWYYHKRIGIDIKHFWIQIAKITPALILPIIAGCVISFMIPMSSFLILGFSILIYTCIYCTSMWFFGMNTEEKVLFKGPLKKIANKFKRN